LDKCGSALPRVSKASAIPTPQADARLRPSSLRYHLPRSVD
jgi:hypothetical protein